MRDPNSLIGQRIVSIHNRCTGGEVVEVHSGCNLTFRVRFDGRSYDSILPVQDLALEAAWPSIGTRLTDWLVEA